VLAVTVAAAGWLLAGSMLGSLMKVLVLYPKYGPEVTREVALESSRRTLLSRGWMLSGEPDIHLEHNFDADVFEGAPRQHYVFAFEGEPPPARRHLLSA
jgi:hypothetical protein